MPDCQVEVAHLQPPSFALYFALYLTRNHDCFELAQWGTLIQQHKGLFLDLTEVACTEGVLPEISLMHAPVMQETDSSTTLCAEGIAYTVPGERADSKCPVHIVANKCNAAGALYLLPICTYTGREMLHRQEAFTNLL